MIRKIIHIDQEKCNGCGKAALIRDDYCDGLGDCLPACPTGAITFEDREAAAYDYEAVQKHLAAQGKVSRESQLSHQAKAPQESQLSQWPVQIKLAPLTAPYFDQAHLLIAADCTAYAYASFHQDFIRGRVTLIGCPKLDAVDYTEKLTQILRQNSIKSLTIVRMEVPCCGGLEHAATQALKASGRFIPWQVVTISTDGRILD